MIRFLRAALVALAATYNAEASGIGGAGARGEPKGGLPFDRLDHAGPRLTVRTEA